MPGARRGASNEPLVDLPGTPDDSADSDSDSVDRCEQNELLPPEQEGVGTADRLGENPDAALCVTSSPSQVETEPWQYSSDGTARAENATQIPPDLSIALSDGFHHSREYSSPRQPHPSMLSSDIGRCRRSQTPEALETSSFLSNPSKQPSNFTTHQLDRLAVPRGKKRKSAGEAIHSESQIQTKRSESDGEGTTTIAIHDESSDEHECWDWVP